MRTGTGVLVLVITAAVLLYRRPEAAPADARADSEQTAGAVSASPVTMPSLDATGAAGSAGNAGLPGSAADAGDDAQSRTQRAAGSPGDANVRADSGVAATGVITELPASAALPPARPSRTPAPTPFAPPAAVLVLGSVFFPSGATTLGPDASRMLDGIATTYKGTSQQLVIVGHADARGDAAVNQQLAARRAEAVRTFLAARGIPAGNMQVRSDGARTPMAQGLDPEANAQNRRVEIRLP